MTTERRRRVVFAGLLAVAVLGAVAFMASVLLDDPLRRGGRLTGSSELAGGGRAEEEGRSERLGKPEGTPGGGPRYGAAGAQEILL